MQYKLDKCKKERMHNIPYESTTGITVAVEKSF